MNAIYYRRSRALRYRMVLGALPPVTEAHYTFGALVAVCLYVTITAVIG